MEEPIIDELQAPVVEKPASPPVKKARPRPRIVVQTKREENKVTRITRENGRIRQTHVTIYAPANMDCSRLPDGIFQGAAPNQFPFFADAALNLQNSPKFDYHRGLQAVLWLPIEDKSAAKPTIAWLELAVDTIIRWRKVGWMVLVHCTAGYSRSTLVTVAYYMKTQRMSRDAALAMVQHYRPLASPNDGFMKALAEYEQFLAANG